MVAMGYHEGCILIISTQVHDNPEAFLWFDKENNNLQLSHMRTTVMSFDVHSWLEETGSVHL